ncbi:MAG: polysaccharide deacetylase family protein, partial [Phycisphaerae bacterium]
MPYSKLTGIVLLGLALVWAGAARGLAQSPTPSATNPTPPQVPQSDTPIVLLAEQSKGGNILTFGDGTKAVILDKTCVPDNPGWVAVSKAAIEWKLPAVLPKGWWHLVVEGNPQYRPWPNRGLGIELLTPQKPSVNVEANYVGGDKDPQRFECWIYSSSDLQGVRIQPASDLWRWMGTWAVRQITLEQRVPAALTNMDAVTLDLPVSVNGSVPLAQAMPAGNWSMRATTTKEGQSLFEGTDHRIVQVPFSGLNVYKQPQNQTCNFYMSSPFQKVTVKSDGLFKTLELRHNVARSQALASEGQLLTTVDPTAIETGQLEMNGANLTGEAPVFAILPLGRKFAVLTSWDDGAAEDIRCAEILHKHGYHPSFFLNNNSVAMKFLDKLEALNVEVGSHCYHHPSLYAIPPQNALEECVAMRKVLEQTLKHPVISFGYPNGYYPAYDTEGDYVLRAVNAAGYWSGRTTWAKQETVETTTQPLALKTDGFFGNSKDLERVWKTVRAKEGAIFYFWGHSWQIGKTDEQWKAFDAFVAQFAHQPDAWYASQGEFALWLWARGHVQITVTDKHPD